MLQGSVDQLFQIIKTAAELKASEISFSPECPVVLTIDGEMETLDKYIIKKEDTYSMLSLLDNTYRNKYDTRKSYSMTVDLSEVISMPGRAQLNFYESFKGVCLNCSIVPLVVGTIDELGVPPIVKTWLDRRGIIIVSGLDNSGKTTTLTSMVGYINSHYRKQIVILDSPIKYLHENKMSFIRQREVGTNTPTYAEGLRDLACHRVNTVVVGEISTAETMEAVLETAERGGIQVLASIAASDVTETIKRIMNLFDPEDAGRIYKRLSVTLTGILNQQLLPKKGGGRVLAAEYLTNTQSVQSLLDGGHLKPVTAYLAEETDESCSIKMYLEKLRKEGMDGEMGESGGKNEEI